MPLPLYFLGWWPMRLSVPYVVLPSVLLLAGLTVWARRVRAPGFLARYAAGFAGGLVATVLYDASRLVGLWVNFPGFEVIHKFGQLITGIPETTPTTIAVGWAYHVMNGGIFGICYALVAGPRSTVWWGIAWGLFLEFAMFLTYPAGFGVVMTWGTPALTFSLIGHVFYGAGLGLYVRRALRPPNRQPAPVRV